MSKQAIKSVITEPIKNSAKEADVYWTLERSSRAVSRQQTANQRITSKTIEHKKTAWKNLGGGQVQGTVYGGLPSGESTLQLYSPVGWAGFFAHRNNR